MLACRSSLAVGLALMLAPLGLGYGGAAAILHDVGLGALVCVLALAAEQVPAARLGLVAPAAWLLLAGRRASERDAAVAELLAGGLVLVLALVPRQRIGTLPRRVAGRGDAGARA